MVRKIIPFTKMQGLGNDFVVVSAGDLLPIQFDSAQARSRLALALCDRRLAVGGDGLIIMFDLASHPEFSRLFEEPTGSVGYIYVNGDGSPSVMCGNGLRCAALWAKHSELVQNDLFTISTQAGLKEIRWNGDRSITIDLGEPILDNARIPVDFPGEERFLQRSIGIAELSGTCVNMGNPHVVIFDLLPTARAQQVLGGDVAANRFPENYAALAPKIQNLSLFPQGVNVEFVVMENASRIRVYIWERGCGATLACATGAAAAVVAGVLEGRLERDVHVQLLGGSLQINWSEIDNHVRLTGPAAISYTGTCDLANLLDSETVRSVEAVLQ